MLSTCEVGISISILQVRALRLGQVRGGSGQDHTEQQQQKESKCLGGLALIPGASRVTDLLDLCW